jgi:hypothetical protein
MPIGIVSQTDYEKEIINKNVDKDTVTPARSGVITDMPEKGRGNKLETPEPIRALVAQEILSGGTLRDVAREYNISQSSASAYAHAATSTASYNQPNAPLKKKNNIFKDRIVKRAGRLALTALDSISPDDFRGASLRDKASVAQQMASVVRDMIPDDRAIEDKKVQIVIYAPAMKTVEDYHTAITVDE